MANDMPGMKFGRLTVIERRGSSSDGKAVFLCKCDCGREAIVSGKYLRTGHTKSCGCINKEAKWNIKHGKAQSPIYNRWAAIMQRCYNPHSKAYKNYGGRGIAVCNRWHSFNNFLADMGDVPSRLTIERIDTNKEYSPENCKWATMTEQQNNRRNNRKISYKGQSLSIAELAAMTGVSYKTIHTRISRGQEAVR